MRKWEAEHDADFGYAVIQNDVDGPVALLAWRHQAEHLHSLTGTKERAWRLGAFIVDALNAAEERKNNATVDDWVTDKAEWCQRCFTFHWNEHE